MDLGLLCCEGEDGTRRARLDPVLLLDDRIPRSLRLAEAKYPVDGHYFTTKQTEIRPFMRKEVTQWMLEVCEEQGCEEVVFLLAVNIMDRCLSTFCVRKSQFQLLAAVCLLLASKMRQCRHLTGDLLCHYTDNSVTLEQLKDWELLVVGRLHWDLSAVVPTDYLDYVLHNLPEEAKNSKVRQHAYTFICLCATESQFLAYSPSVVVSASIATAVRGLGCRSHDFEKVMTRLHNILEVDQTLLQTCANEIEELLTSSLVNLQQQQLTAQSNKIVTNNTISGAAKTSTSGIMDDFEKPETPTDIQDIYF